MDIRNIKKQANQIYLHYRQQIIPEFFYVGYVSLLAQYLQSGLFSFFVSLFLCPISHGYVKCAMKLVDEEKTHIDYHESMVGIIEFARVFPIYFVRKIVIFLIVLIVGLPIFLSYFDLTTTISLEWLSTLGNTFIQIDLFIPDFYVLYPLLEESWVCLNVLACLFCYLFVSALLMPMPYVMELEEFSWSECIQYSLRLMKGQVVNYFRLCLTYCIRHIIYWEITGLILMIIGSLNEILMLFCFVFSLFIYIDIFKGRFEIAKYLFYKEIRGDYDERNNGDEENCH